MNNKVKHFEVPKFYSMKYGIKHNSISPYIIERIYIDYWLNKKTGPKTDCGWIGKASLIKSYQKNWKSMNKKQTAIIKQIQRKTNSISCRVAYLVTAKPNFTQIFYCFLQ